MTVREPRLSKVTVVLSDEELEELRALAGDIPLSPYVRALLKGLAKNPQTAATLIHAPTPTSIGSS